MLALIPWFELRAQHVVLPGLEFAIPVQPFGVLAAIAIVVGSNVAEWRARSAGVSVELLRRFLAFTIPLGLLSSMLLNVLFYEPAKFVQIGRSLGSWFGHGPSVAFPYPGLSSFGGFFGGTLAALWFQRRHGVRLLEMSDLVCFALPFAWLFARFGCFAVHDHPGAVSDFFLAVDDYAHAGLPRHDLGLYEVIWSAAIIPLLLALGRRPRPWGFFTALVTLAYAPVRFLLDFLRALPSEGGDVRYAGLTPAQYAAIALVLLGAAVALRTRRPHADLA
jgi:phosphatidylglycerol:prolipoprotein diacylglycerol transferase